MPKIKKYYKKDGSSAYMFQIYTGVDSLTGKKKRTTRRGFGSQKEAKLALAKLQLELDAGKVVKQDFSTFKEVYELWFENYKTTVKDTSAQRVAYLFKNQILPKFGKYRINQINAAICQRIVNEWNEEGAPVRLRSYAKKIFSYAVSINLTVSNPMDNILIPRKLTEPEHKKENFLDRQQLTDFLALLKTNECYDAYLMFHVLAYTGLRKGELAALTWDKIDFKEQALTVTKTGYYLNGKAQITTTKTAGSMRTISIDDVTATLLKKWKLQQKKYLFENGIRVKTDLKQLVFPNDKNGLNSNTYLNDVLRKYPDLKLTPHGLRHTHASLLFEAGASIKQVQERLGHTSIKTTLEIYTHVTKETEKESAEKFLNYMNFKKG